MIAQDMLVIHGATLLANCLSILEREIHCKLQKTRYALQSRAAACNGLKTIHAITAECRTEFHFVKSLQVQKSCETSCKEGILHAATCLQFSYNAIATQVAKKIAPCNCPRARFYFLQRLQRFFETIASWSPRSIATCNMSPATCNGFLFPTLRDKFQGKLHRVTLALYRSRKKTGKTGKHACQTLLFVSVH